MNKLIRISPPAWIFGLTLLAIVLTGRLVGTSPCERFVQECYSSAAAAHPDNPSLQQSASAKCAQTPCEVKKRGALVPITILITGLVILSVWFRQNAPAGGTSGAGEAKTSAAPRRQQEAPKSVPGAAKAAADSPKEDVANADASALTDEEKQFCLGALRGSDEPSKEELTESLCRLIAPTAADQWKGARLADLDLLVKSVAAGALFGVSTAKYRAGLRASSTATKASPEMLEQTKKALADQCVVALRSDLKVIVESAELPAATHREIVTSVVAALNEEDALSSLGKCGKPGLLRLSVFLA